MSHPFPVVEAIFGPLFAGPAYSPKHDQARLTKQLDRIRETMRDGAWRTLAEISAATGDPQASVSAQLRHLRKISHGSHRVDRRRRGEAKRGLFEYRMGPPGSEVHFERLTRAELVAEIERLRALLGVGQ